MGGEGEHVVGLQQWKMAPRQGKITPVAEQAEGKHAQSYAFLSKLALIISGLVSEADGRPVRRLRVPRWQSGRPHDGPVALSHSFSGRRRLQAVDLWQICMCALISAGGTDSIKFTQTQAYRHIDTYTPPSPPHAHT